MSFLIYDLWQINQLMFTYGILQRKSVYLQRHKIERLSMINIPLITVFIFRWASCVVCLLTQKTVAAWLQGDYFFGKEGVK